MLMDYNPDPGKKLRTRGFETLDFLMLISSSRKGVHPTALRAIPATMPKGFGNGWGNDDVAFDQWASDQWPMDQLANDQLPITNCPSFQQI